MFHLCRLIDQSELADALRKRKSRSDASDEDLGLPHSPSTPPRKGIHTTDGNTSSSSSRQWARHPHHSSLGILNMANSGVDVDGDPSLDVRNESSIAANGKREQTNDEVFPELSLPSSAESEMRLSHSAAKHKMAVRPKKKGPTRRPAEVSVNGYYRNLLFAH